MAIHNLMDYQCNDVLLFSENEQERFNKVFRMLAKYHLNNNHLLYATGSPKMNASKRRDNLNIYRYLLKVLSLQSIKVNDKEEEKE